jgi:hypothetical protein
MVVKKGYSAVGAEEIIRHFFGIGKSIVEPANKKEIETFLFLIDTNEKLALDFLNCWLKIKNLTPLSDCVLSNQEFLDIINRNNKKKKKKFIKERNDS